ncbi:MAG: hypothetical protein WCF23_17635 [Candidatus Nitrosopolaris sp.]
MLAGSYETFPGQVTGFGRYATITNPVVGPPVPIHYNKSAGVVLEKRIIISTNLSLKKLFPLMRFDNMIILNSFHI